MEKMFNACRLLADYIQQLELDEDLYKELEFLRNEFVVMLREEGNQQELFSDFNQSNDFTA
jgi:hypothetical protein